MATSKKGVKKPKTAEGKDIAALTKQIKDVQALTNPVDVGAVIRLIAPMLARVAARYATRYLVTKLNRKIKPKLRTEVAEEAAEKTVGILTKAYLRKVS